MMMSNETRLYHAGSKLLKNIIICLCLISGFTAVACAQDSTLSEWRNAYDQYEQKNLHEKLFVHTNKSFFLCGEMIWFKIYDVDGAFNRPLAFSEVAYLEVLDQDHHRVLQAKISLKKSGGKGSLYLPFSLRSGNYRLRAYTGWMKNFPADYFFQKTITIVNTSRPLGLPLEKDSLRYHITFFPEGGNLVNGLMSKVAFRATDQYGKGIVFDGILVDETGNTVASFRPSKFGMGHFLFTPRAGHHYKALLHIPGAADISTSFPTAYKEGDVMRVSEAGNEQLRIKVNSNISYTEMGKQIVYLLAQSNQRVKVAEMQILKGGSAEFLIDNVKLGAGISQLTVFNSERQPVCERIYFKRPEKKLLISATADQQQYALRSKVSIDITTSNQSNTPVNANLSMSVYRMDSLPEFEQNNIYSYLWLSSDLKGVIESPEWYFQHPGAEADTALDNLMLTHGWRKFRRENVLKKKTPSFEYVPEYHGEIITGKLTHKRTGKPVANVQTFLSVPGRRIQLYSCKSNADGMVWFDMKDFYGPGEIVAETNTRMDTSCRIDIFSPFSEEYSRDPLRAFDLSKQFQQQLLSRSISMQVQNAFSGDTMQQFYFPPLDSTPFYDKPYKTYLLDNYTRFTTMEEVMREYVAEVSPRKHRDGFHFTTFNSAFFNRPDLPVNVSFFQDDPLVLLDGVPVFDLDKLIAFDPLKVQKLEVVANRYYWGSIVADGIVSYTTYKGDMGGFQLNPNALILDYNGLQEEREFYSPVYETEQQRSARIADFRNQLFWSPDIKTDENGKSQISFYTSDLPGKYRVIIQGINDKGNAGSGSFVFEVKKGK